MYVMVYRDFVLMSIFIQNELRLITVLVWYLVAFKLICIQGYNDLGRGSGACAGPYQFFLSAACHHSTSVELSI